MLVTRLTISNHPIAFKRQPFLF